MNSDPSRDLIRDPESDAAHILRQAIRIFPHDAIHLRAISIIYFYRQCITDAVLLQIYQRFPKILFFFHLDSDLLCFSFADTLHFRQALRLFFYDPERVIAEFFHNTGRQCLSHSADRTGSQISFHSYTIRGGHRLVVLYFKLSSIHRMFYILPFGSDIFSLSQALTHADTSHFFPFHHQYHDGISIFTVLKDNMIYISCNAFHFYSSFCCVFVAVLCEMPGKCRGCGKR